MHYLFLLLALISLNGLADEKRSFVANTLISPPYIYQENEALAGSAIDLVNEMFRRAGEYQVKYVALPWKRAVMKVQSGEADMLLYAAKNESRKSWGRYVDSVLINTRFVLFKLRNKEIALSPDFSNGEKYRVAVRRGYIYKQSPFLDAINNKVFKSVVQSGSTAQSIELLMKDRIDFFIGDYRPVMHYLQQHGQERLFNTVKHENKTMEVFQVPTFLLLSRKNTSPALQLMLYQALESMKADGTYDRLVSYQSLTD